MRRRMKRFWCCNTRVGRPHRDGCASAPINPLDQIEENQEVLEPGDIAPWEKHR